jgi:hypothetical protein
MDGRSNGPVIQHLSVATRKVKKPRIPPDIPARRDEVIDRRKEKYNVTLFWTRSTKVSVRADVVAIEAGIAGVAFACHAVRRSLSVAVLDRGLNGPRHGPSRLMNQRREPPERGGRRPARQDSPAHGIAA